MSHWVLGIGKWMLKPSTSKFLLWIAWVAQDKTSLPSNDCVVNCMKWIGGLSSVPSGQVITAAVDLQALFHSVTQVQMSNSKWTELV